jgi:hypothetical protein
MNAPLKIRNDQRAHWRVLETPISFADALGRVEAADKADGHRTDVAGVDLSKLVAEQNDAGELILVNPGGSDGYEPRKHAFAQLCGMLKAPSRYMAALPAELALSCLNHGLGTDNGSEVTLRLAGSEVRGVVSNRFGKFDNGPMLHMLGDALKRIGVLDDVQVVAMATGNITNLRIVLPNTVTPPDGHTIQTGFDAKNSEVGGAAIRFDGVSYRLICQNGQVWQDIIDHGTWRHVGEDTRLRESFASALPELIESAATLTSRITRAHEKVVDLKQIRKEYRRVELTRPQRLLSERSAIIEADILPEAADEDEFADLPDDTSMTLWNAMNGVTAAAQRYETSTRLDMEARASRLLAA